jgi:glycine betaine/choline ABC-type transport system substrate-binding protein
MRKIWAIAFLVLISSCKIIRPASDGGGNAFSTYQEDLSGSLPQYPDFRGVTENASNSNAPTSVQSVDTELEKVQSRFAQKNKSEPYFNGYTVLVFSGIDRNQAFKTQDDLKLYFPDYTSEMQYQQPRYLLKLGQYTYKIEAQKVFSQLKAQFPNARIIQDRFLRKEYSQSTTDQNAPTQD